MVAPAMTCQHVCGSIVAQPVLPTAMFVEASLLRAASRRRSGIVPTYCAQPARPPLPPKAKLPISSRCRPSPVAPWRWRKPWAGAGSAYRLLPGATLR
jgi:hypothetical protein